MRDLVLLKTFPSEIEAELFKSILEGEGIPALLVKDDCGGSYPELQWARGVRLLVRREDLERARRCLGSSEG